MGIEQPNMVVEPTEWAREPMRMVKQVATLIFPIRSHQITIAWIFWRWFWIFSNLSAPENSQQTHPVAGTGKWTETALL